MPSYSRFVGDNTSAKNTKCLFYTIVHTDFHLSSISTKLNAAGVVYKIKIWLKCLNCNDPSRLCFEMKKKSQISQAP